MMLATFCAYTMIGCGLYRPTGVAIPGHKPSQAKGELLNISVIHKWYISSMKIKDKLILTMDQPEAMQEDGDNWNQEEMVEAAVGLIALDSDLQSSGASTSASHPDSDCDSDRPLVSRPLDLEKYRYRCATKRFNALKFEDQCFHFKEYLRSPETFRTCPYFMIHKWDKQKLQEES